MKLKTLVGVSALVVAVTGCESGDVVLQPTNIDQSVDNSVVETGNKVDNNPCVSYQRSGQTFQGDFDGTNCTYEETFVSDANPLTEDLLISELDNGGIHIFKESLWVGEDVSANAAAAGVHVPQEGEGPQLTVSAGSKIAFSNSEDYLRIARGSKIVATGTAEKPIIFSAVADLRDGNATEGDRGLWGGLQINGNGITNKCTDAQRAATASNPHNCHITAEGRPGTYGGNNNSENSGVLRYVVVKHAGYQVIEGSELNAVTLNAVGSGTTIEYVQTYTSQDDGFEMFGGAVNLKNIVAVNVGDDSIDYSEGYVGNIQYALVVHTSGGNRCIEGDNTGENRADDTAPFTKLRISNMTCITSGVDKDAGTVPTSKGDSEGPLFREGAFFEVYNSIITSNADLMASNECLELDDSEGPQTIAAANAGWSIFASNIVACSDTTKAGVDPANGMFALDAWLTTGANTNNIFIDDTNAGELPATLIEGLDASATAYVTASAFTDGMGATLTVTPFDVSCLEDNFDAAAVPALATAEAGKTCGASSFFDAVDFIGAVSADNNWVAGWTVGL